MTSPLEEELLRAECPDARIHVLPTHYPPAAEVPAWEEREGLLFVGGFRHAPNRDAARWLVEEILPLVRRELGPLPAWLIGEDPPVDAADPAAFTGPVDDLEPYLAPGPVSIAPLSWGAGLKGKVHESLAHGCRASRTPVAAEGFGAAAGRDLLVAEDAAGLAEAVVSVYLDGDRWRRISQAGLSLVRERYGRERFRGAVAALFDAPAVAASSALRARKTSM
ncbi:MAG: glycosyltransferase family 4 protein [Thermoanaerobaculia bacterium]